MDDHERRQRHSAVIALLRAARLALRGSGYDLQRVVVAPRNDAAPHTPATLQILDAHPPRSQRRARRQAVVDASALPTPAFAHAAPTPPNPAFIPPSTPSPVSGAHDPRPDDRPPRTPLNASASASAPIARRPQVDAAGAPESDAETVTDDDGDENSCSNTGTVVNDSIVVHMGGRHHHHPRGANHGQDKNNDNDNDDAATSRTSPVGAPSGSSKDDGPPPPPPPSLAPKPPPPPPVVVVVGLTTDGKSQQLDVDGLEPLGQQLERPSTSTPSPSPGRSMVGVRADSRAVRKPSSSKRRRRKTSHRSKEHRMSSSAAGPDSDAGRASDPFVDKTTPFFS